MSSYDSHPRLDGPLLSLDSLSLTDTQPQDTILAARDAGFDIVSLWVQAPPLFPSALLTADKEAECAAILADSDLEVFTLEVFDLSSIESVEAYRDALERGTRLGAKTALTINFSNPDKEQVADILGTFASVASEYGLGTNFEPVAGGQTSRLQDGAALIAASGADVGLTFDPWHVVGADGDVADLGEIDSSLIRYAQLCDGPVPIPEADVVDCAVRERAYPGEGQFPLLEMLERLPRGLPLGIECPSVARARSGRTPLEQAQEAMAATRRLLERHLQFSQAE